ncbi:unnamed protein product [Closterium sp. NIES-64]|nr:unnamed protein product [Closterium sp. NIES-64]
MHTISPQGEQQLGGQPGVTRAPHGEQQAGEQPGVTGAPQGVKLAGGQPMVPGEPQGVQQAGGQGVQQAGGQSRVPRAPQGEQQAGGQPGVTGAPQGAQQPGGSRGCPGHPKERSKQGGDRWTTRSNNWRSGVDFWSLIPPWRLRRSQRRTKNLPCRLPHAPASQRFGCVLEGRWRELFDSAMAAARPAVRPLSYTRSDHDPDAIRLSRCRSRCKVGEWSRGLACLTAGELARPSEVMVQSLREKHPARAGEVPQWVRDFTIDTAQRPSLTTNILARAIHTAARASAAGPSGWVTEHLRDTFLTEPTCLSHLLEVFNQWVAGQVPERARPWLAASNLVGLSKPNGDVRPVAIGEVLPRILARALCISLCPAMVSYFLPDLYLQAGPFVQSLESARGSRQGDPLGPFLFAFTQQQVMEPVTREFKDLLFLSYADDTYILGPAARILEAFWGAAGVVGVGRAGGAGAQVPVLGARGQGGGAVTAIGDATGG